MQLSAPFGILLMYLLKMVGRVPNHTVDHHAFILLSFIFICEMNDCFDILLCLSRFRVNYLALCCFAYDFAK